MALNLRVKAVDGSDFDVVIQNLTAAAQMSAAERIAAGVTDGVTLTIGGNTYFIQGTLADFYKALAGTSQAAGFDGWGRVRRTANIPVGPVAYASVGTDAAGVAGTLYEADHEQRVPQIITGIAVLNGTVVGTDNLIVYIRDADGNLLGTSALAGTLGAGADAFQEIALTAPILIMPGRYIIGLQLNGTTHANQRIAASTYLNLARSTAGVFGTIPATAAALTTFTAGTGPVAYLYT